MLIFDNIHGYIEVSDLALKIIDTSEFQRMRRITQTGGLKYVYPTACHTRFEHSIGTYFLSKELVKNIKTNQPDLKISDKIVELVGIAGLCHDLGHVCFSHLFDDLFLSDDKYKSLLGKLNVHEHRSIFIFKHIIKKYDIEINDDEIIFVSNLIYPKDSDYDNWKEEFKVGKFILTIVSNEENSLDTDKFDYIKRDSNKTGLSLSIDYSRIILQSRVIDDKICYPKQILKEIYNLFFVRYHLYKQLYTHKAVIGVDLTIRDCLKELDNHYNIAEWILDPEKYVYLTDDIIFNFTNPQSVKILTKKLDERKFYKLIKETKVDLDYDLPKDFNLKDDYQLMDIKIGFVSGSKPNPLNNIWIYDIKNKNICYKANFDNVTLFNKDNYQERFIRIYRDG